MWVMYETYRLLYARTYLGIFLVRERASQCFVPMGECVRHTLMYSSKNERELICVVRSSFVASC